MSPEPSAQRSGWCLGSRSLRNMQKKLGVSVFLLRGQSPKLPPPETAAPCRHLGN